MPVGVPACVFLPARLYGASGLAARSGPAGLCCAGELLMLRSQVLSVVVPVSQACGVADSVRVLYLPRYNAAPVVYGRFDAPLLKTSNTQVS